MSVALAAEAAAATAAVTAHEAFYNDPEFWVLVAFVITIGLAGKAVYEKISTALDDRSRAIGEQIEEAARLRDEAQELLASYQRKQRDAAEEARQIAERAKAEADYLSKKAQQDLDNLLARRERQARERIAQAETAAIDEVRVAAIDLALNASRRLLAEKITGGKADALIDAAIEELPDKLH